jgi:hypothetical protein
MENAAVEDGNETNNAIDPKNDHQKETAVVNHSDGRTISCGSEGDKSASVTSRHRGMTSRVSSAMKNEGASISRYRLSRANLTVLFPPLES